MPSMALLVGKPPAFSIVSNYITDSAALLLMLPVKLSYGCPFATFALEMFIKLPRIYMCHLHQHCTWRGPFQEILKPRTNTGQYMLILSGVIEILYCTWLQYMHILSRPFQATCTSSLIHAASLSPNTTTSECHTALLLLHHPRCPLFQLRSTILL